MVYIHVYTKIFCILCFLYQIISFPVFSNHAEPNNFHELLTIEINHKFKIYGIAYNEKYLEYYSPESWQFLLAFFSLFKMFTVT